ncbi:lasso peptide biosynthesis B2 protein [Actinoplanes sp. NPDC051470]|uniref:lasso peptide biosynthesis B2 protein n=1 Tax=unclassified Actinoplanes TaxID=2626549 RepID=UPI003432EEEA
MTVPVAPEESVPLRWHEHVTARVVVVVAWALTKAPPRRLRRVLQLISRGARPADAGRATRARQVVVTVSARCAAGHGCLQRSVAICLWCRATGYWPDWYTGVRTRPFRAHAWVEAGGSAVGEAEDMTLFHRMLAVRLTRR